MKSTILKLRSTTRKSKELARNFHRILMPLHFCKLGVGNIIIPYLVPASRPRDWTFVSFRKWNKTSGWFIRAVPFSVFIMLSVRPPPFVTTSWVPFRWKLTHRISSFPLSSFRLPRDSNPGPRVFSPMGSISGTN